MRRGDAAVLGALGVPVVYDVLADRYGWVTISDLTRRVYHTDHLLGVAALGASWAMLTGWVIPHWINGD